MTAPEVRLDSISHSCQTKYSQYSQYAWSSLPDHRPADRVGKGFRFTSTLALW